jgi:aflatoxin B1 aldehyde reductase
MMNKIKLILGTMTFGPQVDAEGSRAMLQRFVKAGYHEVDTAYVYNEGVTEKILGPIFRENQYESLYVATKVHPRVTGRLDGNAVITQCNESLRRLCRETIDILYLHFPDPQTPIEGALEACDRLYKERKIKELGLSNFPAWTAVDIWHLCKERGWLRPCVYQGMYNGLSRNIEKELFPAIRKLGMRFYAFNPLAGGMLTGKHTDYNNNPEPGRFTLRQSYRNRYWKKAIFEAVGILTKICREEGLEPAEAAYRWLAFHSCLDMGKGDGIIIGASNMEQFEQNLSAVEKGKLPESVVNIINDVWETAKPESPEYFQYYIRSQH